MTFLIKFVCFIWGNFTFAKKLGFRLLCISALMVNHKDGLDPVGYDVNDMSSASAPSVEELIPVVEQSTAPPPSYRDGIESDEQPMYTTSNPYARFSGSRYSNNKQTQREDPESTYDDIEAPLLGSAVGDVHADDFNDLPPPPEYAPYRAKFKQKGKGVISRDPHINEDGEALYRFLLDHNSPPAMEIKVRGKCFSRVKSYMTPYIDKMVI